MALKFRTTGIRKGTKHRIILLVIVFLVSLIFFYVILNRRSAPVVSEMKEPTLPTVSVKTFGTEQLMLRGYTSEMDASQMTDDLIPLGTDRKLSFTVNTYGNRIDKASYEIHTADTSRTVSSDRVTELTQADNTVSFDTEFTNLLEKGQKYSLILSLKSGQKTIRYYSQLMISDNPHLKELISFASDFHDKSLSDNYNSLGKYLEPSADAANSTSSNVAHVTIHSSINDLGMQSFSHKVNSDPIISVTDVTDDTASLTFEYTLTHDEARYLCTEKYRIRYGTPRMYLLNFDRKLNVVPSSDTFSVKDGSLRIGESASVPAMTVNEPGSVAAFVQAGSLYEYNVNRNQVTSVFSFYKNSDDLRCLTTDHDIRILNIDASGSMDFVVYGYMNCGTHEGKSGIDIYHYDSSQDVATEEGFINSQNPLSYLQDNFSELLYRTSGGRFYCLLNKNLLGIDLATKKTDVILRGLEEGQYCVSPDMRYIAWTSSAAPSSEIKIRDLSSDSVYQIKGRRNQKLRALCFMNDNLVYGKVSPANLETGYMSGINIVSFKNEKLTNAKSYSKSGLLITRVTSSPNALKLTRINSDGSKAASDTILNTLVDSSNDKVALTSSDGVRAISFSQLSTDLSGSPKFSYSRLTTTSETISLELYK